jgi:hypothetical protein
MFAHDPRLPYFDIEKPRMFYDSSYVSDTYEISRAAHKAAKENLEEQRDRQEEYYDKKAKYRMFTPGDQVIIYFPNPPPGISLKFYFFWKTFTVIEMVGRVKVKASQHNKSQLLCTLTECSSLTRPEAKKKQPRTFTASELTSEQKESGPDWTENERLVSKKMKKKQKFSGTSADVRRAQHGRSQYLLPLPEQGSHFCSQGHRLLLLLLLSCQRKATDNCSEHLLLLPLPERGSSFCRQG